MKALNRVSQLFLAGLIFNLIWPMFFPANAETVKLKNGDVIEGTLIAEDDQQVTLEVRLAGGTITSKRVYKKSEIAEIVRPTAEQKAQAEIQAAYEAARKNQLDPSSSFPLTQYDKVISEEFAPFLAKYPTSSHVAEILKLSDEWQKERDQVAAGKGKARGQWMSATEAAALISQDRAQYFLQQGQSLLAQGRTEQALQQFLTAASATQDAATVNEANALQSQTYQQWIASLDKERRSIEYKLPSVESKSKNAEKSLTYAEKSLNDYRQVMAKSSSRSSQDSNLDYYKQRADRAKGEWSQAQTELTTLRTQLASLQRQIADLQSRLAAVPAARVVVQANPTIPAITIQEAASPQPVPPHSPSDSSPMEKGEPIPTKGASTMTTYGSARERPPPMPGITADEISSVLNSKVSTKEPPPATIGVGRWSILSPFQVVHDGLTGKGTGVSIVGLVIVVIGTLWLLIVAFSENLSWGIACLIIPFATLVFACAHFRQAKWPFFVSIAGWVLVYAGVSVH